MIKNESIQQESFYTVADTSTLSLNSINSAPTFLVGDGVVTTSIGPSNEYAADITLQPDGKILVAGSSSSNGTNNDFALVRYNTNGSLDTSFSSDGMLTTAVGMGSYAGGASVTLQSDGKILVAGYSSNGTNNDFALVRYNTDGSLDKSFSGDGIITTAVGSGSEGACVTIQSDGKILVAGVSYNGTDYDFALVRYNIDGSLDNSFSSDGILTTAIGLGTTESATFVTVQSDGKILVTGYSNGDLALLRYSSDGSLDNTFSGDGQVTTSIGLNFDSGRSITLQSDGKILVAGTSRDSVNGYEFALVRYNTDGSLDTSFSSDGILTTGIRDGIDIYRKGTMDDAYFVTVQADGKILVAGSSNTDFAMLRYNTDGTLDTSFGVDGKLTVYIGSLVVMGNVTVQADGKIIAAFTNYNGSKYDFGLVRLNSDGSLDRTFDIDNFTNSLDNSPSYTENFDAVILDYDVQIYDAELFALNSYANSSLTLARHNGANAEDLFSGSGIVAGQASGNVAVSSTTIGTYTCLSGTLTLSFNSSATQALVNQALQSLAYQNSSDAPPASIQIDWTFNDGNAGTQGTGGAQSVIGITTVNITSVNDAPVLTTWTPKLTAITENGASNIGQTVATLLGSSITDVDANPLEGIAVYATAGIYGSWQYRIDSSSNWINMATVSTSSALLLRDTDLVRWLPDGTNGTTASLSYFGWDQSIGSAGFKYDLTTRGGSTAYSSTGDTASLGVTSINDAPTFMVGSDFITTSIGNGTTDIAYFVTVQADGKILVAGSSNGNNLNFALVRYNTDGSLDNSFSDDGIVTIAIGNDYYNYQSAYCVVVQTDGKILVAGSNNGNFALVRYNSDGSLDASFSGDGKITTSIGLLVTVNSITVQADGKILLAGYNNIGGSYSGFSLVRYNADGSLDNSFSDDGMLTTKITTSDIAQSITVQADGKILVAGYSFNGSNYDFALVRYNTDGSLDNTFSDDGMLTTAIGPLEDQAYSITVQPDGKILVAGSSVNFRSYYDFALVSYNSDGSLDNTFSSDGKVTADIGSNTDQAYSVTVQDDGKILLAGRSYNVGTDYDFALVRFNTDGSLDTSFNSYNTLQNSIGVDGIYSVIMQADCKILVTGTRNNDFTVVRYNSDGSADTSFLGTPSVNNISSYTENSSPVILDNSVQISDIDLNTIGNYAGSSITLSRHGGANAEDLFSSIGGFSAFMQGSAIVLSSTIIGTVTQNSSGTLKITFNSNATQNIVNQLLSSIAYINSSDNPTSSVQIDWTFNDGNIGSQGSGGAQSVTGSSIVNITALNDAPNGATVTLGIQPNSTRILRASDFGFIDAEDGSSLSDVRIDTLPTQGKLYYQGSWLTTNGLTFTAADLTNGYLTYEAGLSLGSFTFSVKDSSGIYDLSPNTLTFQSDSSGPVLSSTSPGDNATGVALDNNIVLTFNEAVALGESGSIRLYNSTGTLIESFDVATNLIGKVSVSSSTITINPTTSLLASTGYYLNIDNGAITDIAGNAFVGIGGSTTLNFVTVAPLTLTGDTGSNTLAGGSLNDTLDGGLGADTMVGGAGDDTYLVDNALDVVTELSAEGNDLVKSNITFTLPANIEDLRLTGTANINGTGNLSDNTIVGSRRNNVVDGGGGQDNLHGGFGKDTLIGGDGNDVIDGGFGKDILTGGKGADVFNFSTHLNSTFNIDTITDFTAGEDVIQLDQSIFSAIGINGMLGESLFCLGSVATLAGDRIVYDQTSGALYYDADGNGAGAQIQFATLLGLPTVTNADFIIVA